MALFDSAILNKVKQRLQGDTQPVETADTQVIDFQESILFNEPTQPEKESQKPLRLPQLELDMSDFLPPQDLGSTQVIPQIPTQSEMPDATPADQTRILAEEIARESLTDEEHDMSMSADTTRDSSVQKTITTKAELLQIEKDLSEAKRMRNIQPIFEKRTIDPVDQLINAFETDEEVQIELQSEPHPKSSPVTSPLEQAKPLNLSDSDSDAEFDTRNVLDILDQPSAPPKKKKSPIDEYAQKLKRQLPSSPTGKNIVLELSGDESVNSDATENEVPQLSKEQAFLVRQKFSKKQFKNLQQKAFSAQRSGTASRSLFNDLRRANAKQLTELRKANPDAELIEEIEKEEEVMGTLLDRELERVRRIRKKEKLAEKAKKALLETEDADYTGNDPQEESEHGSDVPDSEVDSSMSASEDSFDESDSNDDVDLEVGVRTRNRRAVVSDDEEEEVVEALTKKTKAPAEERSDDSYMFGGQGNADNQSGQEDEVMGIHSDPPQADSPGADQYTGPQKDANESSHSLFSNLPPPSGLDVSFAENAESAPRADFSFHGLEPTQESVATNEIVPTQIDTQPNTQASTQLNTQNHDLLTQIDPESDTEDFSAAVAKGREAVRGGTSQAPFNLTEDEEGEVDEEEMKQQVANYEARIRRKELKARKRRKEMERRGLKSVLEGEAEESDDEWKGIGGKDNEDSDQANSDDERMIDNNFNIDLNDEEVRKKFMEQYQIKDRNELEKLIDDIKNHKLTKRARSNRFDIELSDEEDEILLAYRRQKLEEQKQRLLANQKAMSSAKTEKSKAFFESMNEDSPAFVLDESDVSEDSMSDSENKENETPGPQILVKKTIKLKEDFVQRQLSFLSKTDDDHYEAIQKVSDRQHGVDDAEDLEDVAALKQRSLMSLYSKSQSEDSVNENGKRTVDYASTDEDDDDDLSHVFKKPSVVSSFRSFHEKQGAQISTTSFSGVTVNKQYKAASGSKASITYMAKTKKQTLAPSFRSSRAQEIEKKVEDARNTSGIFENGSAFS